MTDIVRNLASKIAALAILAALVFAAYAFAIKPLIGRLEAAEDGIEQQRKLLGHLLLEAKTVRVTGESAADPAHAALFISRESEASRVAFLQSRVSEIASAAGARVGSSRAMAERDEHALRLISVEAQVSGRIDQIQRVLHGLETGQPALVIDSLEIVRSPVPEGVPAGDLDVRLVVTGAVGPQQGRG